MFKAENTNQAFASKLLVHGFFLFYSHSLFPFVVDLYEGIRFYFFTCVFELQRFKLFALEPFENNTMINLCVWTYPGLKIVVSDIDIFNVLKIFVKNVEKLVDVVFAIIYLL